jgi:hypothetical protein
MTAKAPVSPVRRYLCLYQENDYAEWIEIDYRFTDGKYQILTSIQGVEYFIGEGNKWFSGLSELLEKLPLEATITLHHRVFFNTPNGNILADLDEIWSPAPRNWSATVMYQLHLKAGEHHIITEKHSVFGMVHRQLREQLPAGTYFCICHNCHYMFEHDEFTGSDDRLDQLYCFRDKPQVLEEIRKVYPRRLGDKAPLVEEGIKGIDALHSCSRFKLHVW